MKCHACGVEKDPSALEGYPWPEEDSITDEPIPPFFELDVEPSDGGGRWRRCTTCHSCFHRLSPDVWISQRGWESLNPVTPFADLPLFVPRSQ